MDGRALPPFSSPRLRLVSSATVSSRAALLQGRKTLAERKKQGLLTNSGIQNEQAPGNTSPVNYATAAAAAKKSSRQETQTTKRRAAG
jgi:hypothetical protein